MAFTDQVQALYDEGHGVIFATGHVGVWDVSGHVAGLLGLPITSVFRPSPLPALNRLIERLRTGTFNEAAIAQAMPEDRFRRIGFRFEPSMTDLGLRRAVARFPYAPADPARLDQDCYEAYSIQVQGLMKRLQATGIRQDDLFVLLKRKP